MITSKKLLAVLLSVVVTLLFFGCSKSEEAQPRAEGAKAEKPATSEVATAKLEKPAPEPVQEGAAAPVAEAEQAESPSEVKGQPASDRIKAQLFVMSYCPFGTQAENIIIKSLRALKGYVDFKLHFVVDESNGALRSLHGQKEVDKNSVQICAGKVNPEKQLDFIVEWNQKPSEAWRAIASNIGIDPDEIQNCLDSGYGIEVQKSDAKLCQELNVRGSPTLIIEGNRYNGPRSSKHFFESFCGALKNKGAKPPVCDNPPDYLSYTDGQSKAGSCGGEGAVVDEKPYNIIVVYPENAVWPMDAQLKTVIAQTFPKAKIERVSDKSDRGKEIIKKTGVTRLPAVVSTDAEFAKSKPVTEELFSVECQKGLCFIKPEDLGSNFYISLKPRKETFEIFYRPDSARVRKIIPEIINILKQNNYNSKKTRILIKPYLAVQNGVLVAGGGDSAIDEARREAVIAEAWADSLGAYLQSLSNDFSNWDTAAQRAGIKPSALSEKAQSSDANNALLESAGLLAPFGLGPRADIVFLNNGQELVIIRNASEFDQLIKRLP